MASMDRRVCGKTASDRVGRCKSPYMNWLYRLFLGKTNTPGAVAELADDELDISQREDIEAGIRFTASLEENLKLLRAAAGPSSDLVMRRLKVGASLIPVTVVHLSTMTSRVLVEAVIRMLGLGLADTAVGSAPRKSIRREFEERLLQSSIVGEVDDLIQAWTAMARGDTLILFDGDATGLTCSTQELCTRVPDEPANETVIRGPRLGFVENLGANMGLLRQAVKTPNLWFEELTVGTLTRTKVAIGYIKGLASEELIQEARRRVGRIRMAAVLESGHIEEMVEDDPISVFPLVFRTERPDRIAACLLEGRVAILTDNTPFVLAVPMDLPMLLQAPDDYYEKVPIGSVIRALRTAAFFGSMLLPGVYVAIMNFHQELVATQLLLRITAAREGVPFPVMIEVFMMEILFELLREAGIRLPRAIGPAVTIVGALVLGEAAISAGFVSPAVVIVVALTAISSFTAPTFSLGISARLIRFGFIILGGVLGLFGVQFGALALLIHIVGLRSFGHPFAAPAAPLIVRDLKDMYVRTWHWQQTERPELIGAREPGRTAPGQRPRPGIDSERPGGPPGGGPKGGSRR